MRASALAALILFFLLTAPHTLAQDPAATPAPPPQTSAVLVKLSPPIYPPLARVARIMGDVKLQLLIRKDGSVESAEVISGHPMLKQAATESAKKSMFLCQGCSDEVTAYFLTYTFGFRDDGDCGVTQLRSAKCLYLWKCGIRHESVRTPVVGQTFDRVVILADSMCIETVAAH
jgi:TonB family protein